MKGSRKGQAPEELTNWLKLESADWKPAYPFDDSGVRTAVVSALRIEQRGLCVYCGRRLDMSSPGKSFHIEHFRPQANFGCLAVDHANLFLSCGQQDSGGLPSKTCGTHKGDWFDELRHIAPEYPACALRFRFLLTGEVEAAENGDDAALEMIKVLRLDHPELIKERETVLLLLDSEKLELEDFWDSDSGMAEGYAHVAYQHFEAILP